MSVLLIHAVRRIAIQGNEYPRKPQKTPTPPPKKQPNREEQAFSRKLHQILHLLIPTLPIAEGMTETLSMLLIWQGANFTTNSTHSQNPDKLWSPVHAFGINSSDLEDTGVFARPRLPLLPYKISQLQLDPKQWICCVVIHMLQVWGKSVHPHLSGFQNTLILPPNHEGPLEHSFTLQESEISEDLTGWVINWVLFNPEKKRLLIGPAMYLLA